MILFWGAQKGSAQSSTADEIYTCLDIFLEDPNTQNLQELTHYIDTRNEADNKVRLAKVIAYCNIGYQNQENNALQEAISAYEKAQYIFLNHNLKGYDIIEYALKPLGNLYIKTQAYTEAENTIKEYLFRARETGQKHQMLSGVINLSALYNSRGDFDKSISILSFALEENPENQNLKLNLASTYFALNRPESANQLLEEIISSRSTSYKAYQLLAEIHLQKKEYSIAVKNLEKALSVLEAQNPAHQREKAKIILALAETFASQNEKAKALFNLHHIYQLLIPFYESDSSLPDTDQLYPETALMDALDLHAQLLGEEGELEQASTAYDRASTVNHLLFLNTFAQESRLLIQQNIKRRSEKQMSILYQLYQKTKARKWMEKAFSLDAETKANVVLHALDFNIGLQAQSPESIQEFQQVQQELSARKNAIYTLQQEGDFNLREMKRLQESYNRALSQQNGLSRRLQKEILAKDRSEESEDINQWQEQLALLDATAISYFIGAQEIYQFELSSSHKSFKKLTGSREQYLNLTENIRDYIHLFEEPETINNNIKKYTEKASGLYDDLSIPKAEHLIIIPDGLLAFIPFQALLTKKSNSTQYEDMPFLIQETSLSYLLSLREIDTSEGFNPQNGLLGLFPIFENTDQELIFSKEEAKAIQKSYSGELLTGKNASKENFLDKTDKASVLHISSHAIGGDFSQEPAISFIDQIMPVNELYNLQLSPDLVVLSACETGIGKVVKGEAPLSLARGFEFAGASNILFSLWEVNDWSTAQIMAHYYKYLKKTKSRNFALTQSTRKYLSNSSIDNTEKSPYYWGAFVYYGVLDETTSPISSYYLWIAAGILLLILLIGIIRKRIL